MLGVPVEMGYCRNQDFFSLRCVVKSVGKTFYETPPCLFANLGPCFRHEQDSANCRFHYLKEAIAQSRQLVIIVPNRLIQFPAGWREKSDFQR